MKLKVINSTKNLNNELKNTILVIPNSQLSNIFDLKKDKEIIDSLKYINSNKIEMINNSYVLTFHFEIKDLEKNTTKLEKIGLYTDFKNFSIYVASKTEILQNTIISLSNNGLNHAEILLSLLTSLTENDYTKLENIEDELDKLEEKLTSQKSLENCTSKISVYRKTLIKYKHHYEQLTNIIDFFSTRQELLIHEDQKYNYLVITKRIPKLYNQIIYLRENLSQLRDSYQSQVEIKQNHLMKIFTIINVIFLPLQLIVGWYGMNVYMPETKYAITYPIILVFCLIFIIIMLIIFHKKKYFK